MSLISTEPPLVEPLSLADLKTHLRLETAEEDALLGDLIAAARGHLEAVTGLALISQGFRLSLDDWPAAKVIHLPRFPVQSIDGIRIFDAAGLAQPVPLAGMLLDSESRPARLVLARMPLPGQAINGIEIDFSAGFGMATEVPPELRRALLLHAALMYEFRGSVPVAMQPAAVPAGYERLISPWTRRAL
ncbi:head-tail connector protein [Hoeflea marina]|nr:phage head-tail connector protein [Hoeflea marina]